MTAKSTTVELGPEDAALITRADGKVELVIPGMEGKDDEVVPNHVAYIAACAYGISNTAFTNYAFSLLDTLEAENPENAG